MKRRSGFTLIEMLVTVSIITILTGIGLATYTGAGKKSRDARRQADLESIRSALELYRADNGSYPTGLQASHWVSWINSDGSGLLDAALVTGAVKYLDKLPIDPGKNNLSNGDCGDPQIYVYDSAGGNSYTLYAALEQKGTTGCTCSVALYGGTVVNTHYCVGSP